MSMYQQQQQYNEDPSSIPQISVKYALLLPLGVLTSKMINYIISDDTKREKSDEKLNSSEALMTYGVYGLGVLGAGYYTTKAPITLSSKTEKLIYALKWTSLSLTPLVIKLYQRMSSEKNDENIAATEGWNRMIARNSLAFPTQLVASVTLNSAQLQVIPLITSLVLTSDILDVFNEDIDDNDKNNGLKAFGLSFYPLAITATVCSSIYAFKLLFSE